GSRRLLGKRSRRTDTDDSLPLNADLPRSNALGRHHRVAADYEIQHPASSSDQPVDRVANGFTGGGEPSVPTTQFTSNPDTVRSATACRSRRSHAGPGPSCDARSPTPKIRRHRQCLRDPPSAPAGSRSNAPVSLLHYSRSGVEPYQSDPGRPHSRGSGAELA